MAKSNAIYTHAVFGTVHQFKFIDGEVWTFDTALCSDDINFQFRMHGSKQKLIDSAAIARNTETGKPASLADKKTAIKKTADNLLAGKWAGDRAESEGGMLLDALLRAFPDRNREAVVAWLKDLPEKQKAGLRIHPPIKKHLDAIREEKGKDLGIDPEVLLAQMPE